MFKRHNKKIIFAIGLFVFSALFMEGARQAVQSSQIEELKTSQILSTPKESANVPKTQSKHDEAPSLATMPIGEEDKVQVQILNEILLSHNDNDPRLDSELRQLGPEAKKQFRSVYQSLPRESRNERGTIVFLIGRNLSDSADFDFLKEVLAEEPCLNLTDCKGNFVGNASEEEAGQSEVALNYPQAVVLESVERLLANRTALDKKTHQQVESVLKSGAHSETPMIAHGSQNLLKKL